ncbi:NlpC/P60 family protein [Niallia sp. Krafla_26]|uniref:C40 family peptidase n=1 Tax=Niallia sp. Krafla_26 TaxID=3064703 RepID=UPI003D173289
MRRQKLLRMITVLMLVFGIFMSGAITTNAQVERIPTAGVFINGKVVNGINPVKVDGIYYLPFTQLAKALGYNHIKFDKNTLTYEVTDGSTIIRATMGGTRAKKGNEYVNIKPPLWMDGIGYISLHAGGALFNSYITFKKENGSIQIENPATKYIVHAGDTLYNISRIHHTTVNELKKVNNLTSNIIKDGQVLKIPDSGSPKEMEPIKEEGIVRNVNEELNADIQRQNIITEAKKYIGAKYKWGATLADAPNLFDCSSYTQLVFKNNGITLPRVSRDQASKGVAVPTANLEVGDLMYFTMKDQYTDGRVAHVGIYMGDGSMIHVSTSKGVIITSDVLNNSYWSKNYLFSKRIIQ